DQDFQVVALTRDGLEPLDLPEQALPLPVQLGHLLLRPVALGRQGVALPFEPGDLRLQRLDALLVAGVRLALALGAAPNAQGGHDDDDQPLVRTAHLVLTPRDGPDAPIPARSGVPSGLWFVHSGGTGRAAVVVTGGAVPPNALPSSPTAFRRVYFVRRD